MYLLFQIPSFHSPGSSTPMYDNCEKSESPLSLGDRSQDKCCFRKTYVFTRKENYHQIKRLMLSTEWTLGPKMHLMRKEYAFYKSKSKTRNISYFTKWSASPSAFKQVIY